MILLRPRPLNILTNESYRPIWSYGSLSCCVSWMGVAAAGGTCLNGERDGFASQGRRTPDAGPTESWMV